MSEIICGTDVYWDGVPMVVLLRVEIGHGSSYCAVCGGELNCGEFQYVLLVKIRLMRMI